MNQTNNSIAIKKAIEKYLDQGIRDKQVLYSKVVEELNVPRPTVRRVARDLRTEYAQKIKILQSEIPDFHHKQDEGKFEWY